MPQWIIHYKFDFICANIWKSYKSHDFATLFSIQQVARHERVIINEPMWLEIVSSQNDSQGIKISVFCSVKATEAPGSGRGEEERKALQDEVELQQA